MSAFTDSLDKLQKSAEASASVVANNVTSELKKKANSTLSDFGDHLNVAATGGGEYDDYLDSSPLMTGGWDTNQYPTVYGASLTLGFVVFLILSIVLLNYCKKNQLVVVMGWVSIVTTILMGVTGIKLGYDTYMASRF